MAKEIILTCKFENSFEPIFTKWKTKRYSQFNGARDFIKKAIMEIMEKEVNNG